MRKNITVIMGVILFFFTALAVAQQQRQVYKTGNVTTEEGFKPYIERTLASLESVVTDLKNKEQSLENDSVQMKEALTKERAARETLENKVKQLEQAMSGNIKK